MEAINLAGLRVGKLTVMTAVDTTVDGNLVWLCDCDCGNTVKRRGTHLMQAMERGSMSSCGCQGKRVAVKYAVLVDGELRTAKELAKLACISESGMLKRITSGLTVETGLLRQARNGKRYEEPASVHAPKPRVLGRLEQAAKLCAEVGECDVRVLAARNDEPARRVYQALIKLAKRGQLTKVGPGVFAMPEREAAE